MVQRLMIILAHALVGWGLCGAIIGIGRRVTSLEATLVIHAVGAPLIFVLLSLHYFRRFHYTTPMVTALLFLSVVLFLDFFLVALLVEKSFAMFRSVLGTWIPFALIFASTYLTGASVNKRVPPRARP